MKLIGLTGNIASGKSTVAQWLVEQGAAHLDADRLVHQMYEAGTEVTAAIAARFGEQVLAPDGSVNRKALGPMVFNDQEALRALEKIVHPRIGPAMAKRIQEAVMQAKPPPAMVIEAVKLIESGRHKIVDQVWFVIADELIQKERMIKYRGHSAAEADARLQAQPAIEARMPFAHVIIHNNGTNAIRNDTRSVFVNRRAYLWDDNGRGVIDRVDVDGDRGDFVGSQRLGRGCRV